jgi:hypothetical protein
MKKYTEISIIYKGCELCFYFEDPNGIETITSLYSWEAKDKGNRRIFEVENKKEAMSIVNSNRMIKSYVGL